MLPYRSSVAALGLIATITFGLAAAPSFASTHSVFDTEETAAIERIVRDYIQKRPEIILDALRQLEERRRLADQEQSKLEIALNRAALLNDPGSPVGGNPNGDVTVVEFFDYRCPYCKAVTPRLAQLLEEDGNIRFVYKEWPILGPISVVGARAALAAWRQGMYEEFHDQLMGVSGELSEEMIFDIAENLGLNVNRLREDMNSTEIKEILQRNTELAASLKIGGTPAFVIGDVLVPGAIELSDLKALVEQARSGG